MSRRTAARFATVLLAAATLVPASGQAFAATPAASSTAGAADRAALQKALDEAVADGIPGVIAEVRDAHGTWRSASGTADLSDGRRAEVRDRFRIGSVTKSFVSTVVLQLVNEGRIGLDDPIERGLPGVVPDGADITVRQLLNHTSGLYDYLNVLLAQPDPIRAARTASPTPRELIAMSAAHAPEFAPGTSWKYSNTNYVTLGLLIEQVTGHPLGEEITRRIVRPLHLRDTSFPATPAVSGPHLHGYEWLDGPSAAPVDLTEYSPAVVWGAGTMISTSDDLTHFYRALFGGALLPPRLLKEMRTPHPTDEGNRSYGLGLESRTLCPGTPAWGHSGSVAGYETFSFTTADGTRQITLSLNRNLTASPAANDTINKILTLGLC